VNRRVSAWRPHGRRAPARRRSPSPCAHPGRRSARPASHLLASSRHASIRASPGGASTRGISVSCSRQQCGVPEAPRQTYQRARGTKQHQRRSDDRPISHPSRVPSTTIRGLSEIDGPTPSYSAFPLVVLLHKSYKDKGGMNYGPRPPTARLQTTAIHFPGERDDASECS
jgi:hypothetical protein